MSRRMLLVLVVVASLFFTIGAGKPQQQNDRPLITSNNATSQDLFVQLRRKFVTQAYSAANALHWPKHAGHGPVITKANDPALLLVTRLLDVDIRYINDSLIQQTIRVELKPSKNCHKYADFLNAGGPGHYAPRTCNVDEQAPGKLASFCFELDMRKDVEPRDMWPNTDCTAKVDQSTQTSP